MLKRLLPTRCAMSAKGMSSPALQVGIVAAAVAGLLCQLVGCTQASRLDLDRTTGGNAALFGQFRAYDGQSGEPLTFDDVVRRCAAADVVLFGEEHSDAVCNQLEAQLLAALAAQARPVALAMEFFESDTQACLDQYLEGQIDEPAFRKATRQGRAYVLAHRPLIEMCRAAGIPVIAANAPRRLVREYRQSDLEYAEFRAGLEPSDQQWLPPENEYLGGEYHERFIETMTQHDEATPGGAPAMPPPGSPIPPGMPPPPATPDESGVPGMPPATGATAGGPHNTGATGSGSAQSAPTEPAATSPAVAASAVEEAALLAELGASLDRLAEAAAEISRVLEEYAAAASQPVTQPASPGKPVTAPEASSETGPENAPASQPAEPMPQTETMPQPMADPEAFYRAQLLWDEAMASSVAEARACRPQHRVMLVVGGFHVMRDGGTAQKLRHRRPNDRVVTVAYSGTQETCLTFDPSDCNAGDIIIYGIQPPPKPKDAKPAGMPPMTQPAPASMPMTQPAGAEAVTSSRPRGE